MYGLMKNEIWKILKLPKGYAPKSLSWVAEQQKAILILKRKLKLKKLRGKCQQN